MSLNPFNWFPLSSDGQSVDDLQRESDRADARLAELNRQKYERGEWTEDQFYTAESQRETGSVDVSAEVRGAAAEGAVEGLKALPEQVRGALNTTFGWSVSFIPWWGWIALAGAVFWWLGGGIYLRGILARGR